MKPICKDCEREIPEEYIKYASHVEGHHWICGQCEGDAMECDGCYNL